MKISISDTKKQNGALAAESGAKAIRATIAVKGHARIILATGASQFEMLEALVQAPDIDWAKCDIFHLDEYVGVGEDHGASFVRYLRERFVAKVPAVAAFHAIDGQVADMDGQIGALNAAISEAPIDVAFVGIGENGHLAFNDPPADFETEVPYMIVTLDEACRQQQAGEGWFENLAAVPEQAISMSVQQILKSKVIICTVPDERKSDAVKGAVEGPVSNLCPASIMQTHDQTYVFLDAAAASKLSESAA
ncbi:glucosamine-6-phosphate deaminase [Maritalea sp. S77]|uniref:glucosamine-6-phosphate deaminase n=1 Tax=Maritalea sp. S77 TaxID=3415125 RepID=UPI003C7CF5EB